MNCKVCKEGMRPVESVNSGNSVFVTYQCKKCLNRITKCEGLSNISTI